MIDFSVHGGGSPDSSQQEPDGDSAEPEREPGLAEIRGVMAGVFYQDVSITITFFILEEFKLGVSI